MGLFSKKTKVPATGFYAQPKAYQDLYGRTLDATNKALFNETGGIRSDLFTPLAQTADETRAFDLMRAGLTPTNETLTPDIAMLMNPYEEYVTGGINREAAGANSLVNQAMSRAGQIGSNRSFLGTSDVEQTRLNNIGQMRANQYNTALDRALTVLPQLRQQDIQNLTGIGGFQRELDMSTKQAPVNAAQTAMGMFNQIPTQFGNFGTEARTVKTSSGLGGILGKVGAIAGNAIMPGIGGVIGGGLGGLIGGGGDLGAGLSGAMGGLGGGGTGGILSNVIGRSGGAGSSFGRLFGGFSGGQSVLGNGEAIYWR
jgi:hypothetical protein